MAERPNALVLKTSVGKLTAGSNPAVSAVQGSFLLESAGKGLFILDKNIKRHLSGLSVGWVTVSSPIPPRADVADVADVSVVIPCFNDAAFLRRALQSLTHQTVQAGEIIVVDNNSTDCIDEVVAEFPAVRLLREPRQGIYFAAATGYDAACKNFIVRLDADSLPPQDFVEKVVAAWKENEGRSPRVVALTGRAVFVRDGKELPWISRLYLYAYLLSTGSALGHPPLFGTNFSMRSDWWKQVRDGVVQPDAEIHDDLHLSFAVRPGETVAFVRQLCVAMDARALYGAAQLARRFRRGMHTMLLNFRTQPPPRRLSARLRTRLRKGMHA